MSEEFDAVEQAIWEETYGHYFQEPDDYYYEDDEEDYMLGYNDGFQSGFDAASQMSIIDRLRSFVWRWWVNRRMHKYAQDIDDIPF